LKRQALLSLFDMVAYTTDPKNISSITELEDQVRESIGNVAYERSFSHNFHHPFSGGYSSGYYSYFWADVLANDAFAKLTQNGTYDPQAAKSFEDNILAKGSMEPADELYRAFAGNDPDVNVLFRELKLPEIDEDGKPQILAATPPAPSI
jgi:oligopeptidase A